jgi:hypothetical protein
MDMKISLILVMILSLLSGTINDITPERALQQPVEESSAIWETTNDISLEAASYGSWQISRERNEAMLQYLSMPPQKRVTLWREGKGPQGLLQREMEEALIVQGIDAVPYLAEMARSGSAIDSINAIWLLCESDRFVPVEEFLLPEIGGFNGVRALKKWGRPDEFMKVDGRRIGKEGVEAVLWAAEQTKDKSLRFFARYYSGLLEEDFRKLSLQEQIRQWRDAVARSKGILGIAGDSEAFILYQELSLILIEEAPESIPALLSLLEKDSNSYVREDIISKLRLIDSSRVRLRALEVGRKAIEAIHRAIEKGGLKPTYGERKDREQLWEEIKAQVFNDEFPLHHGSTLSIIALAFEKFYGEKITKRLYTVQELIEAPPEMRQFVTYLTKMDRFFPSWEYILAVIASTAGVTSALQTKDRALLSGMEGIQKRAGRRKVDSNHPSQV